MIQEERIVENVGRYYFKNEICYFEFSPGAEIDLQKAKSMISARIEFCQCKDYLVFVDLRNLKSFTNETGKHITNSPTGMQGIISVAFLVESLLSKMLGNVFLKIFRPPTPSKLFTNEEEAIKWLNTFRK